MSLLSSLLRRLPTGALLFVLFGCGGGDEAYHPKTLVAVNGKVILDDQPLTKGIVSFVPDAANALRIPATGKIDSNGGYKIMTDGKSGAPLGRYKICVSFDPAEEEARHKEGNKLPGIDIPTKYRDPAKTPLIVDVVSSPTQGIYDLKLSTKK